MTRRVDFKGCIISPLMSALQLSLGLWEWGMIQGLMARFVNSAYCYEGHMKRIVA